MRAESCGKNSRVLAHLISGDEGFERTFSLKTRAVVQEINLPIKAGDSLEVWVEDIGEEGTSFGVMVGFLYQVGMKDLASTKFLIDQFEALIEENQDATD